MKKLSLTFVFFAISLIAFAAPKRWWTYRMVSVSDCYAQFFCDVRSPQPVCTRGNVTPVVCICEPWSCQDF